MSHCGNHFYLVGTHPTVLYFDIYDNYMERVNLTEEFEQRIRLQGEIGGNIQYIGNGSQCP
jgi:hypothetical protein